MEERACSLHISRSLKFLSVVLVLSVLYRSIQKVYSRLKRGEPSVMLKAQWPALYNSTCMECTNMYGMSFWSICAISFSFSALFPSTFLRCWGELLVRVE